MAEPTHRCREHRQTVVVTIHALRQLRGVPYEVERRLCPSCLRVLEERPLRRAAA